MLHARIYVATHMQMGREGPLPLNFLVSERFYTSTNILQFTLVSLPPYDPFFYTSMLPFQTCLSFFLLALAH